MPRCALLGASLATTLADVSQVTSSWTNDGVLIAAAIASPATTVVLDSKENTTTSHAALLDVTVVSAGPAGPTGPAGPNVRMTSASAQAVATGNFFRITFDTVYHNSAFGTETGANTLVTASPGGTPGKGLRALPVISG